MEPTLTISVRTAAGCARPTSPWQSGNRCLRPFNLPSEIVQRCLEAGLVEGRNLAVEGTLVIANASEQSRVPRERWAEIAQVSRTVQEYLTELERQNPVAEPQERPVAQEKVSTTDPDAAWAVKSGPAALGYYDNYLVDTTTRVILSVSKLCSPN